MRATCDRESTITASMNWHGKWRRPLHCECCTGPIGGPKYRAERMFELDSEGLGAEVLQHLRPDKSLQPGSVELREYVPEQLVLVSRRDSRS